MTDAARRAAEGALRPLPRSFYDRPTPDVARDLLGKILVRHHNVRRDVRRDQGGAGGLRLARIVEVEAYLGERDAASHARRGPTPRARIMFGAPGHLYVYLVYGMHHCMNVVTEADGTAGAVLLRGAEPLLGFGGSDDGGSDAPAPASRQGARALAGPAKLTAGFGITRAENGVDLCTGDLVLATDGTPSPRSKRSPRIGVDYAGAAWAGRLLRYYVPGSPGVSGPAARRR